MAMKFNPDANERLQYFLETVTVNTLAETLVAMANGDGGDIVVGVSTQRYLVGVSQVDDVVDKVFQATLLIDPVVVLPFPTVEQYEGKSIVRIRIPEGLPHVYCVNGRYFWREGSRNEPIPAKQLRRLLISRGVLDFETQIPLEATLDDLDWEKVDDYCAQYFPWPNWSREEILLHRQCAVKRDNNLYPTHAGILLFGKQPQRWFPSSIILAAKFLHEQMEGKFVKKEIYGTLPEQLQQAEAFIFDHMTTLSNINDLKRDDIPEYPPGVIREILVNAIAHRDYTVRGDSIHLHMYNDRLEVHSPGKLPGPINLSNLLTTRFARNPVIMQVLSDMGYVERMGYGLKYVVKTMKQNDLPEPKFEEVAGTFRVLIPSAKSVLLDGNLGVLDAAVGIQINHRQRKAISFLKQHGRITNRDYRTLIPNVSAETIRRDLSELVEHGVLIKIGDKKGTYYILRKP